MTTIEPDDARLIYVPIEQLTTPPEGTIEHRSDYWWSVHPEHGAIFYRRNSRGHRSPQCNQSEVISRRLTSGLYPWAECVQIPHAFWPISVSDYA